MDSCFYDTDCVKQYEGPEYGQDILLHEDKPCPPHHCPGMKVDIGSNPQHIGLRWAAYFNPEEFYFNPEEFQSEVFLFYGFADILGTSHALETA